MNVKAIIFYKIMYGDVYTITVYGNRFNISYECCLQIKLIMFPVNDYSVN